MKNTLKCSTVIKIKNYFTKINIFHQNKKFRLLLELRTKNEKSFKKTHISCTKILKFEF